MNPPTRTHGCKTILVIEDDPSIRESLAEVLEMEGYPVVVAENGRKGLDKLATLARPCLILLDLMMPVMNGLEFLEACKRDVALVTIPVVMVTAYENMARDAVGPDRLIKKPIDLDRLLDFVKEFCG